MAATGKVLEKISHPGELNLFEKIVKIGTALWGIRKNDGRIGTGQVLVKPVAVQCVKDAIDKKDASLKTAISAQNQTVLSALDSRNSCQKAALDKMTAKDQFVANKLCVDAYQKSVKDNNKILEKARNDAWKIYRDDLKACSLLQKENKATSTDIISSSTIAGEQDGEIMVNDGEDMKE